MDQTQKPHRPQNETTPLQRLAHEVRAAIGAIDQLEPIDLAEGEQVVGGSHPDYDPFILQARVPMPVGQGEDPTQSTFTSRVPLGLRDAPPGSLPMEIPVRNLSTKMFGYLIQHTIRPHDTTPWFLEPPAVPRDPRLPRLPDPIPVRMGDYILVFHLTQDSEFEATLSCAILVDPNKLD